jgi:2-polyprenyl-3-methyl-5-hydroxy-6-metoxy-1,4-benzoquinol methylase
MQKHPGSFRDPNGFVYWNDGMLLRQVNPAYAENYDYFKSNLYDLLIERTLIVAHEEVSLEQSHAPNAYKVLRPQLIPFISYPYEWSFAQLKDAALLTLRIQKIALKRGMTLKDASSYNIQFLNGSPIFLDTLSFEKYVEGEPWVAYRQFCQHFLAPLALAAHSDVSLLKLLMIHLDGIPLEVASHLLPWRTNFNLGLRLHLHLHAKSQTQHQNSNPQQNQKRITLTKKALNNIIQNLEDVISSLSWSPHQTAWHDYYEGDSYSDTGFTHKQALCRAYLEQIAPKMAWDIGANAGEFSQIAAAMGVETIAWDYDYGAVQLHYEKIRETGRQHVLPLIQDLTNPSPAIGWAGEERESLKERGRGVDVVMALALIHHIVIGNNVPLAKFAHFLQQLAPYIIVEFIPKSDAKVKTLLASRLDIFDSYHEAGFREAMAAHFDLVRAEPIQHSERTLFLYKRR